MCNNCSDCPFVEPVKEIIYQIHVTVDNPINDHFAQDCYSLGVKPLIIDMGQGLTHYMTSATVRQSNDESVLSEAYRLGDAFQQLGYKVARVKVETVPWHPKAAEPSPKQYFETHIDICDPLDEKFLDLLMPHWGFYKSRNTLKQNKSVMIMYRSREISHLRQIEILSQHLKRNGFNIGKIITEFALYDSNEGLDDKWLKQRK